MSSARALAMVTLLRPTEQIVDRVVEELDELTRRAAGHVCDAGELREAASWYRWLALEIEQQASDRDRERRK